ncbi:Carbon storage regulator [Planctomycetes bacterium Pan216]|uniref:Translational regulator CsrA n=1 Tax=Kolteria novifilia TaxID=2527975 RepID=A0A518B761_9BACT|nr:Carbon storage regulator [Planctomycetes bacterium Pan216]
MLVLTRKVNQKIIIGEDIVVTVLKMDGKRVRIGIDAPTDVPIHREEIEARAHAVPPDKEVASC